MSNFPRRSARLSQQYSQQHAGNTSLTSTPSFSQASTASTSPVNDPTTFASQQQEQFRLQLSTQSLSAPSHFRAPLPSPSACEPSAYFDRVVSQNSYSMSQQAQQNNMQQTHQSQSNQAGYTDQAQHQSQYPMQHHNSFSQSQRSTNGQAQGQLPPDFLAEAAKRAQMACLMRDLGDVTL